MPTGMNAKVIRPVNKTKKLIVLGQMDTLVFNNTHAQKGVRGVFS